MMVKTAAGGAVPMRCYYTYQAEFILAFVTLVTAGMMFFLKDVAARRLSGLFLVLLDVW